MNIIRHDYGPLLLEDDELDEVDDETLVLELEPDDSVLLLLDVTLKLLLDVLDVDVVDVLDALLDDVL